MQKTNKKLLISGAVFALLLITTIGLWLMRPDRSDSPGELPVLKLSFDTDETDRVLIRARANEHRAIQLEKSDKGWLMAYEGESYTGSGATIDKLLAQMAHIKTDELAANEPDQHALYKLSDTGASRIELYAGGKLQVELLVGLFVYEEPGEDEAMYRQSPANVRTYVRLPGRDEVYAVEGYLSMAVNREPSHFRQQRLCPLEPDQVNSIEINAVGMSTRIEKMADGYQCNMPLGQEQIITYIEGLCRLSSNHFADSLLPGGLPEYSLQLVTLDDDTVQIEAYRAEGPGRWLILNARSKSTWLSSPGEDLFGAIFQFSK